MSVVTPERFAGGHVFGQQTNFAAPFGQTFEQFRQEAARFVVSKFWFRIDNRDFHYHFIILAARARSQPA